MGRTGRGGRRAEGVDNTKKRGELREAHKNTETMRGYERGEKGRRVEGDVEEKGAEGAEGSK